MKLNELVQEQQEKRKIIKDTFKSILIQGETEEPEQVKEGI
jgi:hypothetical protein